MESIIEQILNMVSGSPELGALVEVMYFFVLFVSMLGMPVF